MANQRLINYLDKNNVSYMSIHHAPAPTTQEIAQRAHVSGKHLAKTVIIKIEDRLAMLVLPANRHVDFGALRSTLGRTDVNLSSESEFKNSFPDCDVGMMPPFGNIYNMDTYVAEPLTEDDRIAFNSGDDDELIQISYKDYQALVRPTVLENVA